MDGKAHKHDSDCTCENCFEAWKRRKVREDLLSCFDDFFGIYEVTEKDKQELLCRLECFVVEQWF